jgi:hypothetical protein
MEMKEMKRILALALTLALIGCLISQGVFAANRYNDVPVSHWAHDVIEKWSGGKYEVLKGDSNGNFGPERPIKLSELKAVFARYFGNAGESVGADVFVTREEAIKYVALAFGIAPADGESGFADNDKIGAEYKPYVNAFQRLGYVKGKGNNNFDPKGYFTRAEALKVMDNVTIPGIKGVKTAGFVDTDGAKLSTIIIEYNVDMTGAKVSLDDYKISNYGIEQGDKACEIGKNPGAPTKLSVDGNKVIIEVNTDYQLGSVCKKYRAAMAASVVQTGDIEYAGGILAASKRVYSNYEAVEVVNVKPNGEVQKTVWNLSFDGSFSIPDAEAFKLFTKEDGTAFHAEDCWEEATGKYVDVDLPSTRILNRYTDGAISSGFGPPASVHPGRFGCSMMSVRGLRSSLRTV